MRPAVAAAVVGLGGIWLGCSDGDARMGDFYATPGGVPSQSQAQTCLADGPFLEGIDISKWQGEIFWPVVSSSGVEFSFVRVSDGLEFFDERFAENWQGAKAAGIYRGAYQFFRSDEDAVAQADLLIQAIEDQGGLVAGDLPSVIDVETSDGQDSQTMSNKIQAWLERVEQAQGIRPYVYLAPGLWQTLLGSYGSGFADYPLWVAHWDVSCPDMPTGWSDWVFWQTTDDACTPGITTHPYACDGANSTPRVDGDLFNGNRDDLVAQTKGTPSCGDGYCFGVETPVSCPLDCTCPWVPAPGRVIDDSDPCFLAGGPEQYWHPEAVGYDGGLIHTTTTDAGRMDSYGLWHLWLQVPGQYQVAVYTASAVAQSEQAKYYVRHDGEVDVVSIDQTLVDGWQELGVFFFSAGGHQSIRLDDNTGEALGLGRQLVFDAVRLLPVTPPTDGGPIGADGGLVGGDAGPTSDSDPYDGSNGPSGSDGGGSACAALGSGGNRLAWLGWIWISWSTLRRRKRGDACRHERCRSS